MTGNLYESRCGRSDLKGQNQILKQNKNPVDQILDNQPDLACFS